MIEFGKTLRLAREAKGYTISQLAEVTRMIHQTIEDLENENFSRIAAPIYGRGFVKLYCEAVGLDPKPMVAEFMEIFSGNRELGIKERTVSPPAVQEEPDAPDTHETIVLPDPIAPEPPRSRIAMPVQTDLAGVGSGCDATTGAPAATDEEHEKPRTALSRYAAPIREATLPSVPPAIWRIATLAAGAILVLWLIALGFKALYRATSGAEADASQAESAESSNPAAAAKTALEISDTDKTANAMRDKVDVPPLYVD